MDNFKVLFGLNQFVLLMFSAITGIGLVSIVNMLFGFNIDYVPILVLIVGVWTAFSVNSLIKFKAAFENE